MEREQEAYLAFEGRAYTLLRNVREKNSKLLKAKKLITAFKRLILIFFRMDLSVFKICNGDTI